MYAKGYGGISRKIDESNKKLSMQFLLESLKEFGRSFKNDYTLHKRT